MSGTLGRYKAYQRECINLFQEEEKSVPQKCYLNIICSDLKEEVCHATPQSVKNALNTLKNECEQLKNKYPQKPLEPCKFLPLFLNKLQPPSSTIYSPTKQSNCPAQKLLNTPFGFGGGIGLNCGLGLPSLPKITLPDIIIPDIILPRFGIPPFFEIKLPSIITEDLHLPDIDLCGLDKCANLFPSLNFNLLHLDLPSFDVSAPIPNLNTQIEGRINFPRINFSLPSLNLFNFTAPEIALPKIPLPKPKFTFAITGIDTSAIFELISTFILNALDIPDFGGCLTLHIPSTFLSIIFPDYYLSFKKFPEIPKIPYCDDINGFCQDVKDSLGKNGWLKKAQEIEEIVNEKIDYVQKKLNESADISNPEVKKQINKIFEEYAGTISEKIKPYVNPATNSLDLDKVPLDKVPFPGVFPIGEGGEKKNRKCLPVPLPERNIILRLVTPENMPKDIVQKKGSDIIIYTPLNIPVEIPIPWPEKLKKIKPIHPIGYKIPKIPLSKISYEKEFPIEGPGFQPRTFSFDFGPSAGDCVAKPPTGGNPIPISKIETEINKIKDIQSELENASQAIKNILE